MTDLFPRGRRPRPNELYSSWMAGTALCHGMNLNALIEYMLGDCYFKRRDIDKFADASIVNRLATVTDTNFDEAQLTSLYLRALPISSFEKNIYTAQWVTHVNNIYSTRRTYGMCYCPLCLIEDKEPYFRVDWRLSFVTVCLKHDCLLNHKCPWCNKEISLYRITAISRSLSVCCWCGLDINQANVFRNDCLNRPINIQRYLIGLLNKAHIYGGYECNKIREYFLSLYYYCFMISQQYYQLGKRCVRLYRELYELLNINVAHWSYDAYEPIARLIALELAFDLFERNDRCNFKLHSYLYSANNGSNKHLVKQIPCGSWCENHDYLEISMSCKRFIAEELA